MSASLIAPPTSSTDRSHQTQLIAELSLQTGFLLTADEGKLNRIVIKCPNTGKLIYTGFAMDPETFGALPIEEMDPLECPACHKIHRWQKKDALFEREDPRAAS